MQLCLAAPAHRVACGQGNGSNDRLQFLFYLGGCALEEFGVGVALCLNSALTVHTIDEVLLPVEADTVGDAAHRDGTEHILLQLFGICGSSHQSCKVVRIQVHVTHTPHGDILQVLDARAVVLSHEHVYDNRLVLVVDDTHGQAVRSSHQRIGHIAARDTGTQGICLHIVGHERLALRFPVVAHAIGIYILALAHLLFCLS